MIGTERYQDFLEKHKDGSWGNATLEFSDATRDDLETMIRDVYNFLTPDSAYYNENPLEERQNYSPSIREFMSLEDSLESCQFLYNGYIVGNPRSDARVSVDGVTVSTPDIDDFFKVIKSFSCCDEMDLWRHGDRYFFWAWWD